MIEGHFVVLEGVDGAGTTTHTKLLADAIRSRGLPVHTTREPSDGPVGSLIRQVLTGRVVVPGLRGVSAPSAHTMALLFAADRLDHVDAEILPNVMEGVSVISDRYDHSSVAYQSVAATRDPGAIAWIRELNRHARRPDLTIVLDVRPEIAAKRRRQRYGKAELYEQDELQARLIAFYRDIEGHFPGERIVHVDAEREIAETAEAVVRHVLELRGDAPAAPR